jgi:ABC-type uncharacterized transport system YnjBCD ATPase subunit
LCVFFLLCGIRVYGFRSFHFENPILFSLSQVIGTLRDQLIYPHSVDQMRALGVTDDDLRRLLQVVDPANGILGQWTLDETRNWINAFSGGQKQRVAMARVFYHRPRYAILDEVCIWFIQFIRLNIASFWIVIGVVFVIGSFVDCSARRR